MRIEPGLSLAGRRVVPCPCRFVFPEAHGAAHAEREGGGEPVPQQFHEPFQGGVHTGELGQLVQQGAAVPAERVPKADKLLRLEVDLGYEKRQILAGIAQYYEPEKLIGRKIVIVANLAPRMMRGLESNGMLLAASLPDGAPVLASFLEEVPLGARLK